MESELEKIDHDNPKVRRQRQEATLEAILTNDPSKKYADPAKQMRS